MACADPNSVIYLRAEGNLTDEVGTITPTNSGVTFASGNPVLGSQAFDFDGSSKIKLKSGVGSGEIASKLSAGTICFWFRTTSSGNQRIYCESGGVSTIRFSIDIISNKLRIAEQINFTSDVLTSSRNISTNTWYFAAITRNASNGLRVIYLAEYGVDDNPVTEGAMTFPVGSTPFDVAESVLGDAFFGSSELTYSGKIDEFIIFDKDFGISKINQLYTSTATYCAPNTPLPFDCSTDDDIIEYFRAEGSYQGEKLIYTGSPSGGTTFGTGNPVNGGQAFDFSAGSDYLIVDPNGPMIAFNEKFTVCGRFKTSSSLFQAIYAEPELSSVANLSIDIFPGNLKFRVIERRSSYQILESLRDLNTDSWYFFAWTRDSATGDWEIFLAEDGVDSVTTSEGTSTVSTAALNAITQSVIGASAGNGDDSISGFVDEIIFYRKILNKTEIDALYQSSSAYCPPVNFNVDPVPNFTTAAERTTGETDTDMRVEIDQDGTAYLVVLPDGASAPTAQQIKDGTDASDVPVASTFKDSVPLTQDTENGVGTFVATGLTPSTNYDVYISAESSGGLQSTVELVNITTLAATPSNLIQDYNLINNVDTEYVGTTTQPNNIDQTNNPGDTDPDFKDPGSDYRLTGVSPGINAAAPTSLRPDGIIPTDDIVGVSRESDIGAYEFVTANSLPAIPDAAAPVTEVDCIEPSRAMPDFFNFLTTFWGYLTEFDRDMFRNYWSGAMSTGNYLWKLAGRFFDTINPETARVCVTDEFYDIQIGPFYSKPLNLDPTLKEPNHTIRPLSLFLVEPVYVNEDPVYRDLVSINKSDYDKIRTVGLDTYAVITPKNQDIDKKYFKVFNLLSSEEPQDRFTSAEIDETLDELSIIEGNFGRVLITGLETGIDQRTVLITDSVAVPSSVTWDTVSPHLTIGVRTSSIAGTSDPVAQAPTHLKDAVQNNFIATTRKGDIVENSDTGEESTVDTVFDDFLLILNDDIFQSTSESYIVRPIEIVDSGTTDSDQDFHLLDSTKTFTDTVKVGDTIINDTTGGTALVVSVDGDDDLEVDVQNFISTGQDYRIRSLFYINEVEEMLEASETPTGTPWAEFTNKSGYNEIAKRRKDTLPKYSTPVEIDDMTNFIYEESGSGRYYPSEGKIWSWFEGYSSSNGIVGNSAYGEYVQDLSKGKYIIVMDGDLSYLKEENFTFYLTTNRSYDINKEILDVPDIQSFITEGDEPEFKKDLDYTFINNIVEFNKDLFEIGDYENGDYLYSRKADRIEDYLYSNYGTLVDQPDWILYNYDKYSGKAAINGLLKSIQNSSKKEDYERALNIYYGLPISPEKSKVIGLYESYGYEIIEINSNQIKIDIKDEELIHPFIQKKTRLFSEGNKDVKVSGDITNVYREDGLLDLEDASELKVGDKLHVKLRNKWFIKRVDAETESNPAYIEIFSPEGDGAIKWVIDAISTLSKPDPESSPTTYPEILIYGTENLSSNVNGIYHITAAEAIDDDVVRLSVYKPDPGEDPIYNDYIGVSLPVDVGTNLNAGFVHMPWPTHKFLRILMDGEKYFKAYLDSPIDTIYDEEDILEKYQTIARNASAINDKEFPNWNEFDQFKKFNGLHTQSNMLELTKSIPGAKFGEYFPSRYEVISE